MMSNKQWAVAFTKITIMSHGNSVDHKQHVGHCGSNVTQLSTTQLEVIKHKDMNFHTRPF